MTSPPINHSIALVDGHDPASVDVPVNMAAVDLSAMRLLVIGQSSEDNFLLQELLSKRGFEHTLIASNIDIALTQLAHSIRDDTSNIDVILLDYEIAIAQTGALCVRLHNQPEWREIPLVILMPLSARDTPLPTTPFDLGATDLLFKPICASELIPRVISALLLKRERDLRKNREKQLETELAERRVMEARLQYLVGHDDLTGLVNRRRLEQELDLALLNSRYRQQSSVLFYLDLDQFKVVNDTEGHAVGDRLLVSVANKLRRYIGASGTLARISSDEYGILIENIGEHDALRMAETLRYLMDEFHFKTDHRIYHIGASIGVAMVKFGDTLNASEWLARADQACHVAKGRGRNTIHLYSEEDAEHAPLRNAVHWVPLIRDALTNNKFRLVFQPVLNVITKEVTRYEALIRMQDENGDLLSPGQFIPVAERMGLIHDIDLWVVSQVLDVMPTLPSYLSLNVNLSSHAFQDPQLFPLLRDKLNATGVKASRITFEITETAAITNFSQTRKLITELRGLGCRFALDDFGVGFNSFGYLRQFPVDYLKIDGAFITNLIHDSVDQTLVKSMIEVARTLNKQTCAEFVEDAQTLELLTSFGVDFAQGNYVGHPQPLELAFG